jgi:putative selenium metabolism protein SsnA
MSSVVLTGGTVVTSLSPPRIVSADVAVADGRIAEVGSVRTDGPTVDCDRCLIVPGLVNAHHHLYASLARGMPFGLETPRTFLDTLRRVWWRLDRALDRQGVWASAIVGGAVALLSGTTTIVDHHASPNAVDGSLDTIGSALALLGARSVLCYEVTDRDGAEVAEAGLEENQRFMKTADPLARGMVGAHASFTLSDETLAACVDLARSAGTGIHIHAAEDAVDQRDCMARTGKRVMARLAGAGVLLDGSLLAHCIHLDPSEIEAVRSSGATAVHNPSSNMNNAVGHARVDQLPSLCLGTDGIGGDMLAEGRAAYWRAREDDPSVGPQWVLDLHARSAAVAGAAFDEPLLGTLRPGAPADLAVLAYDPPTPLHESNLAGHWVFGLTSRHVRDVMVGGEWSVLGRQLAGADAAALTASCKEEAARLWRRMEEIPEHSFEPAGGA